MGHIFGHYNRYHQGFLICEFLNLCLVLAAVYMTDCFLKSRFMYYGLQGNNEPKVHKYINDHVKTIVKCQWIAVAYYYLFNYSNCLLCVIRIRLAKIFTESKFMFSKFYGLRRIYRNRNRLSGPINKNADKSNVPNVS